jgi:hypothetical protein
MRTDTQAAQSKEEHENANNSKFESLKDARRFEQREKQRVEV